MSLSLPTRATRIALAALGSLLCASLAHAQGFIPPPAPWLERPATPETTVPPTTLPPEAVPPHAPPSPPAEPTLQPEGAAPPVLLHREPEAAPRERPFGASFAYAQRSESVDVASPRGSVVGSTDVSVYAGRLDKFVFGCSLGEAVHCPPDPRDASAGLVAR